MSAAPTPVCAFDIAPDGTATPCEVDAKPRAGWRWLHFDLSDPQIPDWLAQQLPGPVATALQTLETRPRFDAVHGGALINLRGVNLNAGADPEDMVALRIWATEDCVITMRRRRIMALDAIRKDAEAGHAPATPDGFLAAVAEGLTERIETVSLDLEDQVDDLEEEIVAGREDCAQRVLELRQTIIKLRRFVGPQKDALLNLGRGVSSMARSDAGPHILETANRAARTAEALEAARDRMAALQDHLESRASATLARNGYVLSIIAAIFLPLGFLTGLFGVNVAGMPGTGHPLAFAILSGASLVIGVALYLAFRWAKWL
ncbi:zinc transporter ZntB [Thalassorhabdomicrobium marinisediminis]|uniref:Zinc transporter ZntB n=1 Tax=Thalassorhabdomicrobium marinisediminis TaxID=2170577 RepID=A0A2T7FVY4_9RHOB|nr:zinc transporter ZntB [Thalassorhabdomicrobium marinisediminis]PVA06333.1 zinc transporter ZntB [Thalassorhabdomicrobium marinisediminis]